MRMADCHPYRKHYARGFCLRCYSQTPERRAYSQTEGVKIANKARNQTQEYKDRAKIRKKIREGKNPTKKTRKTTPKINSLYILTPAEQDVERLSKNHSLVDVAKIRGVSYQTVKGQRRSIKDKHEEAKLLLLDKSTRLRLHVKPVVKTWRPWE